MVMKKIKIKSKKEFTQKILSLTSEVELFSFDIFDTLLARKIEPPEAIHEALCTHISHYLEEKKGFDEVLKLRKESEWALRERAHRNGLDFECHYIDLLDEWTKRLSPPGDENLLVWIRELELSLELSALYVKDEVINLLKALKKASKKIVVTSDMYLGPNEIQAILKEKGLLKFIDKIYVSSTFCICKYSGRLFKKIIQDFELSPGKIVHIGDNPISDYSVPLSLGINAVLLKEKEELRRRRTLSIYQTFAKKRPYWRGKHQLHIVEDSKKKSDESHDFFYDYGRNVLGPIFSTYILGVFEKVLEYKTEKILFLARDGYLLERLYKLLIETASTFPMTGKYTPPATEYAYLTRQTTAAAAVHLGLDHELSRLALYNPKQEGLFSILKAFGLPPEEFKKEARAHGLIPMKRRLETWDDPKLINFLNDEDVQLKIKALSKENFELLVNYLTQIGFFSNKKIALVDIGWNGTIQYFLGKCLSKRQDYPQTYGLYFGFCAGIPYNFSEKDHVEGIFYDQKRMLPTENCVIAFEELFEEAARAPHATTIAYRKNTKTETIEPVFKNDSSPDRIEEIKCNPMVKSMQNGIMDFAMRFYGDLKLTAYTFSDLKPFMATLSERAVVYPRKFEVEHLSLLAHTEDWGYDNVLEVNTGENVLNLPKILRTSNWKYGTLVKWLGWPSVMFVRLTDIWRRA